jgi:hypothetical protein
MIIYAYNKKGGPIKILLAYRVKSTLEVTV